MPKSQLDINTLESWLWECACKIRGEVDAPKYKDYILPLICGLPCACGGT